MKNIFTALYCSLFLLTAAPAVAAPSAANATWGETSKGIVGFGIYDREGTCEELRRGMPLRIGTKNLKSGESSGPLQVKELNYCLLFVSDPTPKKPDGVTPSCASGSIDFSYDAQTNEYRGKYNITMTNRMTRSGEFRAQFCKPAAPAIK